MSRRKFWDIIILILVFIATVMFPINYMTNDMDVRIIVRIGLLVAFIIFAVLFSSFTKIAHLFQGKVNHRNGFLLAPLFLIAFCNLFYLAIVKRSSPSITWDATFILGIVLALLTAIAEELVFRFVIQKNLIIQSRLVKILIASAIFAGCHIFTVISYWNLADPSSWEWSELLMIVYTFFIGVCLGFLYEYTNNIVLPVIFHFFFNLINSVWIGNEVLTANGTLNMPYFINCLCFAAFGVAYLCLFYFVFTKRENR